MKYIVLIFILSFSPLSFGELYVKMSCTSSSLLKVKGPKGTKILKKGSFVVHEDYSHVMVFFNNKNKAIFKVYPWYGVDYKASKYVSLDIAQTNQSNEFSLTFSEKDTDRIHSISCLKL